MYPFRDVIEPDCHVFRPNRFAFIIGVAGIFAFTGCAAPDRVTGSAEPAHGVRESPVSLEFHGEIEVSHTHAGGGGGVR